MTPSEPPRAEDPDVQEAEAYRAKVRKDRKRKGLLIVNTGNGKGKTTAAMGLVMRAWGREMKVGVIQFLKTEGARFGEVRAAERMEIEWIGTGDGWTWTSKNISETESRARRGWKLAQRAIREGDYDLLVLDEFTYTLHYGWLDEAEVLTWIEANKPPSLHLVITGRYAGEGLLEAADLATEMREIKHPYAEQGIQAQPGIEF